MTLPHATPMSRAQAPVIDISSLTQGDRPRKRLAEEIARVCRDVGFFYITNHGVRAGTVRHMFEAAARFFALPLESRMALSLAKSRDYRGYLPLRMIGE